MLYNLTMAIGLIAICWLWGCAALRLANYEKKLNFLEVSVGYALIIIILNLLYFRLNFNISNIKIVVIALSIVSIAYLIKKGIGKEAFFSFFLVIIFFSLFAGLGFISNLRGYGEGFYVFRDNIDDNFNYISMGYALLKHNLSYYLNVSPDLLYNETDILPWGADRLIHDRVSICLPFALMLRIGKGSIFLSAFLYMSILYSLFAPVLYCFLKKLSLCKSSVIKFFLLASYLLGFWGQLNFDLNAWSQLGGLPIIFTIIYLVILKLEGEIKGWYIIPFVSVAFLVYPEASIVYAGGVAIFLFFYYLLKKEECNIKNIAGWFIIIFSAIVLIVIINSNFKNVFSFIKIQLSIGSGKSIGDSEWWKEFDSYWIGRNPSDDPVLNVLNHIISFFGLYFLIPEVGESGKNILIFVEMIFIISVAVGIRTKIVKLFRKDANLTEKFVGTFTCYTGLLIIYLLSREQYWVLGKTMIWMSPFIYYMMVCFIDSAQNVIRKYYMVIGSLIICANLLFYGVRFESAWNGQSKYYDNYPIKQWLRDIAEWDLNMDLLKDSEIIRIEDNFQGHYFHYLKQTIEYAGKKYYTSKDIISLYGTGENRGQMEYKEYDAFVYTSISENGRRELNYVTDLNGSIPSDLIYQKISLVPYDTLIIGHSGFLEGDPDGVWTSEHEEEITLMGQFMYDNLKLCVEVTGFSRTESEMNGKELHIKIGDEEKTVIMNDAGKYIFLFDHVKGENTITFLTDNLPTPYDMGISEDKTTGYGVRIKSIEMTYQ